MAKIVKNFTRRGALFVERLAHAPDLCYAETVKTLKLQQSFGNGD